MNHDITLKIEFRKLMAKLNLTSWEARGLLEEIEKGFCYTNAPFGDIGRFDPADVCELISWTRTTPEILFQALWETGWLKKTADGMFVVADWNSGKPDFIRNKINYLKRTNPSGYERLFENLSSYSTTFNNFQQNSTPRKGKERKGKESKGNENTNVPNPEKNRDSEPANPEEFFESFQEQPPKP
jgi:hypothetical protein